MKKIITSLVSLMFLYSPYTQTRFSDGLLVGGLAGLTAGIVTTAIANQCDQPEVVVLNTCPVRQCTTCSLQDPCIQHCSVARTQFRQHHTKIKRRHRPRRAAQRCSVVLKQQEQDLYGSIRELEALKASICEENKKVELMLRETQLKLKETQLCLMSQGTR